MKLKNQSARMRLGVSCGAMLAALAIAAPAAAQEAPAEASSDRFYEIVVTAQKREQNLNDVGMSITAVSGDVLQDRGIADAADLVKLVPGFSFQEAAMGVPIYNLRGVGYNDETLSASPAVTVYMDEIPFTFGAMTRGVIFDLERVEVLKGPQGTLFGSNSTGGAFNYIAAKPTDNFSAGIDLSFGRFNTLDTTGYVSGPLGEGLKARIAVRTIQGGDWQKSYTCGETLGAQDRVSGRLSVEWEPVEAVRVSFGLTGWIDKSETQAPQLLAVTPQSPASISPDILNYPLPPRSNRAADWSANPRRPFERDDSFYQASLRAEFDLSDAITLTSLTAYSDFKSDAFYDNDGISFIDLDREAIGKADSFFQEVRLAARTDTITAIIGVNYENSHADEQNSSESFDASNSEIFPGMRFDRALISNVQDIESKAIFGNIEFEVSPTLKLLAGARYTDTVRKAVNCSADNGNGNLAASLTLLKAAFQGVPSVDSIGLRECYVFDENFNTGPVFNRLAEDNVSWRAGVEWSPVARTLVYANVSKGYKAGTIPSLAAINASQYAPITQESLLAYEVGVKSRVLDNVQMNVAGFYYDYTDKQLLGKVVDPVFGVIGKLVNIPKSELYGVDADISWQVVDGFRVNLAATYLESKILDYVGLNQTGVLSDFRGTPLPYAPRWQLNPSIDYRGDIGGGLSFLAGASYSYRSGTSSGFRDAILDIDSYGLLDARIGISNEGDRWKIMIWGQNLTDKYYVTSTVRGQDTAIQYTGKPRTFGITLAKDF